MDGFGCPRALSPAIAASAGISSVYSANLATSISAASWLASYASAPSAVVTSATLITACSAAPKHSSSVTTPESPTTAATTESTNAEPTSP